MPSTEAYLGSPHWDAATANWTLDIDANLRETVDSVCELVTEVLDARTCLLYARFSRVTLPVASFGEPVTLSENELRLVSATEEFVEDIVSDSYAVSQGHTPPDFSDGSSSGHSHRIVSPITVPSGRHVGWLIIFRDSAIALDRRERTLLRVMHRDITNHLLQSKRAFEDAASRELQELITQHNEDLIFVKDEKFRLVFANPAFLNLYPVEKRDQVIGYTTLEEYDEEEAELFLEQDKIAFEKGLSRVTEDIRMPDGRRVIIDTVKRRFEDDTGKRYILGISRDITDQENLIRELKERNDELSYFTSIASHDLKSPLNAIRRLLEWIQEDCAELLPEEHVENMQLVSSRADRMQALLDDLLTFARIGDEDHALNDISLKDLCSGIIELLDVPEDFHIEVQDKHIRVNAVPFRIVLLNLIGNAIKHNDKIAGRVEVTIEETRHFYIVSVIDNGPGIDSRYYDKIFQLFQTLKPRDEVEGSGIGLSVVMKYITKYGGKIQVLSDGSSGSTFRVSWPKAE